VSVRAASLAGAAALADAIAAAFAEYAGRLGVFCGASALVRTVETEAARRGCPGAVLGVWIALPEDQALFRRLGYANLHATPMPGTDTRPRSRCGRHLQSEYNLTDATRNLDTRRYVACRVTSGRGAFG